MPEPHEPAQPDIADDPARAVTPAEPADTRTPVADAVPADAAPADAVTDSAPADDPVDAPADTPPTAPARVAPRRRARPDAVLVEARDVARAALADIARDEQIGEHRGTTIDGDRLVTHAFASLLPGYVGWNWFAVLARTPRSRTVTVCEIGLTPGEGALLAPPWVPWADRLRPEDQEAGAAPDAEQTPAGTGEAEQPPAGTGEAQQPTAGSGEAGHATPEASEAEHREPEPAAPGHAGDRSTDEASPDAAPSEADEDSTEIVDDDATLLSRPESDHWELPGEEDDEPPADLSAEAEDVRTEQDTENAVADAATEATEA